MALPANTNQILTYLGYQSEVDFDTAVNAGVVTLTWHRTPPANADTEAEIIAVGQSQAFLDWWATHGGDAVLTLRTQTNDWLDSLNRTPMLVRALANAIINELNILRRQAVAVGGFSFNPANLADGAGTTKADISAPGAQFRDAVIVTAPYSLQGILCTAYVHAADTVAVRLQNETGGAVDLANGTWAFVVWRPEAMAPRTLADARSALKGGVTAGDVDA